MLCLSCPADHVHQVLPRFKKKPRWHLQVDSKYHSKYQMQAWYTRKIKRAQAKKKSIRINSNVEDLVSHEGMGCTVGVEYVV